MKNLIIILIVLIVVSGGGYLAYNNFVDKPGTEGQGSMMEAKNGDASNLDKLTSSIFDLANLNSKQCTYRVDTGNVASRGTIYIADGSRFYGEFIAEDENGSYDSRMLYTSDYVYTWDPARGEGVKMSTSEVDLSAADYNETDVTPQVDFGADYEFDCDNWAVDESMLEIPENVTFVDINAMMESMEAPEGAMEETNDGNACAACDLVPEADRESCLAALGC